MTDSQPSLLVVLPAYNEQEALPGVLAELAAVAPRAGVLVVDDGSTDASAEVARSYGARVVRLPYNSGVGAALRTGLLVGSRDRVDAVVQCDADGQHPPAAIELLLERLGDADIVIGARFAGAGDYRVRGPRKWAMGLLAFTMSRLHRTRLTDVTSGFRAFGPRAIEVLSRELPPEYLGDTVEALIIAQAYNLRVVQVGVSMRERQGGVPSQDPLRSTAYLARVVTMLVLSLPRLIRRKAAA
ncbi:glycosyltransferase family 2 protein [Mumia zhuanghuii]|uniref:Glycosyltransferase family 2 protein n=1 Tax=Mumia zhuanghuii TaxID=2585211 RepID=A0A5C4M9V1_9ACTN|nr:glycosyltransferase family 2 protein [Mumia zhuanghuii]TNC30465.1 glycosyltransferase family 2 protein [Mumia zhuanghuii]TNC49229.1 glycosyltransferase family 2 protein [Mumia zhuanghuii]